MKKFILITCFLFLILSFYSIWFILTKVAPYGIIQMTRDTKELSKEYLQDKDKPEDYSLTAKDFEIVVDDSIKLKCWFIPSKNTSKETVIVLHGVNASKEFMLPTAKYLNDNNFNVVLIDSRGHGKSGGLYCTYGYYEKYDISKLVDYLLMIDSTQNIGIYGNSLGGAIAIQTMAIDSRIKCGVIESTFANLREVVSEYMQRMFFIGPMFLSDIALNKASEMAKFDPDSVNPELSAKKIINPIFMAHGDKDEHIRVINSRKIYNNIPHDQKKLTIVQGADHYTLYKVGGVQYMDKLLAFLQNNLSNESSK